MPLPLDSPEWVRMEAWFGEPAEVPVILRRWLATREAATLTDLLWSRLSAQQTYSASALAALPYLTQDLQTLPLLQRVQVCHFAAMVAESGSSPEVDACLALAERVTTELLESREASAADARGLLGCLAAFHRWPSGAAFFERFERERTEVWGSCPECAVDLEFLIEPKQGWCKLAGRQHVQKPVYSITAAADARGAPSHRVAELLAGRSDLDGAAAATLHAQFMLFLGTSRCPACDAELSVTAAADAVY